MVSKVKPQQIVPDKDNIQRMDIRQNRQIGKENILIQCFVFQQLLSDVKIDIRIRQSDPQPMDFYQKKKKN